MLSPRNNNDHRNERFSLIRQKLTDLSYRETFTVESVDLVAHLLDDLVTTTQSYKQLQDRESRLISDLSLIQSQLFPIRKENARLARENHDLHLDNIKLNEDLRLESENFAKRIRVLDDEINALKLLNKVGEEQLRAKDFIIDEIRDAYESLTDPVLKSRHLVSSSIKISSRLPPQPREESKEQIDPRHAWEQVKEEMEAIRAKDPQISSFIKLQEQLQDANNKIQELVDENLKLKSSISIRDQELARAGRLIGDGAQSPADMTTTSHLVSGAEVAQSANKRIIDQLNSQVDFLNDQLAQREAQLALISRKWNAFESLESDLAMRNATIKSLKEDNTELIERVRTLEKKLLQWSGGNSPWRRSGPPTSSSADPLQGSAEWKALDEALEKGVDQQRLLSEKVALMKEVETLKAQVEQLSNTSPPPPPPPSTTTTTSSASRRPSLLKGREKEKGDKELIQELNKEIETLRRQNKSLTKQASDLDSRLALLSRQTQQQQQQQPAAVEQQQRETAEKLEKILQDNLFLQQSLQSKENLLFQLSRDHERLTALHQQTVNDWQDMEKMNREIQEKYVILEKSHLEVKEQYQQLLQNSQQQRRESVLSQNDYHHLVKELEEKEKVIIQLQDELEQKKAEMIRLSRPWPVAAATTTSRLPSTTTTSATSNTSSNTTTILAGEKKERDVQLVDNDHIEEEYKQQISILSAENQLTRDRLTTLQEDYDKQHQQLQDHENMYIQLQQQYQQLKHDYKSLQENYTTLRKKQLSMELTQSDLQHGHSMESKRRQSLEEDYQRLQKEYHQREESQNQLKDLIQSMTQNVNLYMNKIKLLERTLHQLQEVNMNQEEGIKKYKDSIDQLEDQLTKYKQTLYNMDNEKDDLNDRVDILEEKLLTYEREIKQYQQQVKILEEQQHIQVKKEEKLKKELSSKINTIALFESKCNNIEGQYKTLKESLQQKMINISHSNEDLLLMTKENQILNNTLVNLHEEYEKMKIIQREQQQRLRQYEEEKKILELEKHDLLEHYKSLLQDKNQLEDDMKMMTNQHRQGVDSAYSLSQQLQESQHILDTQSHSLQQQANQRIQLETQLLHCNDQIVLLQRRLESIEADNRRLIQELHGCKQSNVMLNERLAIVMKRAASAQESSKLLTTRLTSVERERDSVKAVLEIERQRCADLVKLVETARVEAATKDIHLQRMQSEMATLSATQTATGSPLSAVSASPPAASGATNNTSTGGSGNNGGGGGSIAGSTPGGSASNSPPSLA